jgi:RecG-like helicase
MPDYLYLIQKKYIHQDSAKIGSTKNIVSRIKNYITPERSFNNNTHNIWSFKILKSKWSCYQLDSIIQYMSINHNIPYVKFNDDGGKEHYYFNNDIDKLSDFLTKIQVEFFMTKEDVDKLKISYFNIDIEEHVLNDLIDVREIKKLLQDDINYNDIKQLLNIKDFQLKQHQIDVRQEYQNKKVKKIFHLVISPTGTGKTVIFLCIALDVIKDTKKDIMILTKRKDILDQMVRRIENDIKKFNRNNISTVLFDDIKIVNCLVNCDIDKLNKTSKKPQIYIVNFDKFTSSDKIKNNYNKIKFDKFGLIIIDESHRCGAPNILLFNIGFNTFL